MMEEDESFLYTPYNGDVSKDLRMELRMKAGGLNYAGLPLVCRLASTREE